jgi:hypothetical protein
MKPSGFAKLNARYGDAPAPAKRGRTPKAD